jgi:hypothetical protein
MPQSSHKASFCLKYLIIYLTYNVEQRRRKLLWIPKCTIVRYPERSIGEFPFKFFYLLFTPNQYNLDDS